MSKFSTLTIEIPSESRAQRAVCLLEKHGAKPNISVTNGCVLLHYEFSPDIDREVAAIVSETEPKRKIGFIL